MLLKGDEGGCKNLEGGVAENGDFRQGGHYPLDDLGVASNRDSSLATQRSFHSAIHERAVTCWDSVRSPGVDDSKRDQPWLTPRGKIKNGRAHAVCRPRA
jgi:hypothetical protein